MLIQPNSSLLLPKGTVQSSPHFVLSCTNLLFVRSPNELLPLNNPAEKHPLFSYLVVDLLGSRDSSHTG